MAAVASDMLDRAIADGRINAEQFREVFASPPLPAAAFGYVYNLAPDIAEKVKAALIDMDLSGTPWAPSDGTAPPPRMVAIDYRKDFATIRDVDDVLGKNHDVGMMDTTVILEQPAEAASVDSSESENAEAETESGTEPEEATPEVKE